jgi:hypothetical protein
VCHEQEQFYLTLEKLLDTAGYFLERDRGNDRLEERKDNIPVDIYSGCDRGRGNRSDISKDTWE